MRSVFLLGNAALVYFFHLLMVLGVGFRGALQRNRGTRWAPKRPGLVSPWRSLFACPPPVPGDRTIRLNPRKLDVLNAEQ